MVLFTRKEGQIQTPFTKIKSLWQYLAVFVTFCFTNLYIVRGEFIAMIELYTENFASVEILPTIEIFIIFIVINALVSTVLLDLFMTVYYYFAFQGMRGLLPFSNNEFKSNIRPFMIIRNLIWAALSATMFIEGGFTIGIGYILFENLSTMIIFIPAFYFMKKHYIKDGYGARVLTSIAIPFLVITLMTTVSTFLA